MGRLAQVLFPGAAIAATLAVALPGGLPGHADETDAGAPAGVSGPAGVPSAVPSATPFDMAHSEGICDVDDRTTVSSVQPASVPHYFIKPLANSNRASYISEGGNRLLDISTGREIPIPGNVDPVPTPDERFITVPEGGLSFYLTSDLVTGGTTATFSDPEREGVYQSTSIVSDSPGSTRYRVLVDNGGTPSVRDYVATHGADGHEQIATAGPVVTLCPGLDLSLPMISKDGKELAAFDVHDQVTKIWSIDPTTGACRETLNLGFPTGKVDFNFNGDEIAFHAFNNTDYDGHYILVPSDQHVGNVYVLKRSTRELTRVTNNTQTNSIYPGWRRDGLITYVSHPEHASDDELHSSIVVADWRNGRRTMWDAIFNTSCTDLNSIIGFNRVVALGALWTNLCSRYGADATANTAALNVLSINPVRCRQMVHEYWERFKAQVAGSARIVSNSRVKSQILDLLSEADLQAACPEGGAPVPASPRPSPSVVVVAPAPHSPAPARNAVPESCVQCHAPRIDFTDLDALSRMRARNGLPMIQEILRRLNLPPNNRFHMPQGDDLEPDERQRFLDYLGSRGGGADAPVPSPH